jgi:hypothetical protein
MTVRLLSGEAGERAAAAELGIAVAGADLGGVGHLEDKLEDISAVLILTDSNDFNALAAAELCQALGTGRVFRLAPGAEELDFAPAYAEGGILFDGRLTYKELDRRFHEGAEIISGPPIAGGEERPADTTPLFAISHRGELEVVVAGTDISAFSRQRVLCLSGGGAAINSSGKGDAELHSPDHPGATTE